ncbi:MAG: RNA-protein complex protein Nop10 [Thermoplasmatales archaeon]|nr:RNA-protein complex protein Nop10 [Thermoplasmatales archaeon]
MRSHLRRCPACGRYSMEEVCGSCGSATASPAPPKFSPEDRYGPYRRVAVKEEYGENGKHNRV